MNEYVKTKERLAIECAEELAPSYMKPLFEREENVAPWILLAMDKYAAQQNKELVEALQEVIRISDRNHDAWNKAKEVIKKYEQ